MFASLQSFINCLCRCVTGRQIAAALKNALQGCWSVTPQEASQCTVCGAAARGLSIQTVTEDVVSSAGWWELLSSSLISLLRRWKVWPSQACSLSSFFPSDVSCVSSEIIMSGDQIKGSKLQFITKILWHWDILMQNWYCTYHPFKWSESLIRSPGLLNWFFLSVKEKMSWNICYLYKWCIESLCAPGEDANKDSPDSRIITLGSVFGV